MFGYQNFPRAEAEVRGLTLSPPEDGKVAGGTAKFDLTLFLFEDGDRLTGALEYNRELFEAATMRRLLRGLENLLAAAVAEPGSAGRLACRCSARRSGTSSPASGTTPPRPTPPRRASRSCSWSTCAAPRAPPR